MFFPDEWACDSFTCLCHPPTPVASTIFIGAPCTVTAVTADVNVTGPWMGEVTLTLTSPAGTVVYLHNLTGGSGSNIIGNFPTTLTPDGPGTMADFIGQSGTGTWTMTATDTAISDGDFFNTWGLNLSCLETEGTLPGTPMSIILDYAPGQVDIIDVTQLGCLVSSVTVDVDITHTWIGDLTVTLTSPAGTAVTLHDQTGGSADNVVGNFPLTLTVDGPGALADFAGEDAFGAWRLFTSDVVAADTGILNSWALNFECN